MNNKVYSFSFFDFMIIFSVIIILSILMSKAMLYMFKDNSYIGIRKDISEISLHLNNNLSEDPRMLYGVKVNHVCLLKNKDFKELVKDGVILNENGIITEADLDKSDNNVILDLSPYIKTLKLNNTTGSYIGVSTESKESLDVYYINHNDDIFTKFKKIDIKTYYKLMRSITSVEKVIKE